MLKYRINTNKLNKTKVDLPVDIISFVDFDNNIEDETGYLGYNKNKVMVTCECNDIDKLEEGVFINTINNLSLNFGETTYDYQSNYTFYKDYKIIKVNKNSRSFSFLIDKEFTLDIESITSGQNNEDVIVMYFNNIHYFDVTDYVEQQTTEENPEEIISEQRIPIYFRYTNIFGEVIVTTIMFKYLTPNSLFATYDDFQTEEQKNLYALIFNSQIDNDKVENTLRYVHRSNELIKITQEEYDQLEDDGDGISEKAYYIINDTERYGDLGGINVFRENFLFSEKTRYEFSFERPIVELKVPIINTFETNLQQIDLLNEYVANEKKKSINDITDLEKDVYYPCVSNINKNSFTDVYTIKINLHFREHRGDDWLVENESFWNGIVKIGNDVQILKFGENLSKQLTDDDMSDLLCFLNFTNDDVHYQKNKLKKSFLRLLYYDSMNSANQNLIGYSTVFFDTNDLFSKYIKYIDGKNYVSVGADKNNYGRYIPTEKKVGIRVDRDSFVDNTRLSSQLVIKDKNSSKTSSEGFYLYIWKDNELTLPQDLYMKVEFNHAGYGRTIPFMMPYWDSKKWSGRSGIKTFEEILNDWNSTKQINNYTTNWIYNNTNTDGHYDITQYNKFSYIHLKYQYDKETDRHIYYLDPDIYGSSVTNQNTNEIVINLYEAKIGE